MKNNRPFSIHRKQRRPCAKQFITKIFHDFSAKAGTAMKGDAKGILGCCQPRSLFIGICLKIVKRFCILFSLKKYEKKRSFIISTASQKRSINIDIKNE